LVERRRCSADHDPQAIPDQLPEAQDLFVEERPVDGRNEAQCEHVHVSPSHRRGDLLGRQVRAEV
jgi:hypothetical protein